jgi:hypothetical protein
MSGRAHRGALTTAAVLVCLPVLAGCGDPGPGVVTSHYASVVGRVLGFHVRVRQDADGQIVDTTVVGLRRYHACHPGARWPKCRDGAR